MAISGSGDARAREVLRRIRSRLFPSDVGFVSSAT
jgi:hypothetical protein